MGGYDSTSCAPCDTTNTSRYHARPGVQIAPSTVKYHCFSASASSSPSSRSSLLSLEKICRLSPKPKGHERFSSVEVVHAGGPLAEQLLSVPRIDGACPVRVYELPETHLDPTQEFKAIFELEEAMMLQRANRQSLIVWIGRPDRPELDGFAGFLGMLPFRGVNVALVSADESAYPDPFRYRTPSGVIEHDATDPARMGKCCIVAMFGPLASRTFTSELAEWTPIDIQPASHEPMKRLPFKIAGLPLPMITYTGDYDSGVEELASRISAAYTADSLFPIVSCGQVVDGIGYGLDVLQALERRGHRGYYFTHRSGETNKRWAEYGQPELLERVSSAKAAGQTVLFLAVGGGCNGNATGVVAAMTNSHFIEVPTTPLHYNDATTSAKKAFSLVRDGKILSKNLLGTFFLPRLVFCINEVMLTSNSASIHSTVGECTKTMNMVAMADSAAGQLDYHNILGAHEFASDTTKILSCIDGFEQLISFIHDSGVRAAKHAVLDVGAQIASLRAQPCSSANDKRMAELVALRRELLRTFRQRFYSLPDASRKAIDEFLTVSNLEIVGAKAMFLAYEDPFEKYRALLFEYAHTLGHAVEAWLAGVIERARAAGISAEEIERATRNHGQCVGMAVIWAGHISAEIGALTGEGLVCHQAMVYLFNSFGGFSFAPVRALCDKLDISKEEFLEECLAVVRLDNKRGYCECAADVSVDQLVTGRPGRMLKSSDANAEVRYMVTIEEERQRLALERAFDLKFDLVAHFDEGRVVFKPLASSPRPLGTGSPIATEVRTCIRKACQADAEAAMRQAASEAIKPRVADMATPTTNLNVAPAKSQHGPRLPSSVSAASSVSWPGLVSSGDVSEAWSSEEEEDALSRCTTYADLPARGAAAVQNTSIPPTLIKTVGGHLTSPAIPVVKTSSVVQSSSQDELRMTIAEMSDFSGTVPFEYRSGYQKWRTGNSRGAKGEARSWWGDFGSEEERALRSWEEFLANVAPRPRAELVGY